MVMSYEDIEYNVFKGNLPVNWSFSKRLYPLFSMCMCSECISTSFLVQRSVCDILILYCISEQFNAKSK